MKSRMAEDRHPAHCLLDPQHHFAFFPQFFQVIVFTLVGGEKMKNDGTEINDQPAVFGHPFFFTFDAELFLDLFDGCLRKTGQHPVAGSRANHKIIGKVSNPFQVQ